MLSSPHPPVLQGGRQKPGAHTAGQTGGVRDKSARPVGFMQELGRVEMGVGGKGMCKIDNSDQRWLLGAGVWALGTQ